MWGQHTQRQRSKPKAALQNWCLKYWACMWGSHSLKTRPSLVKPPYNASPEDKECRFVKPDNCRTEVMCGVVTPKDNVRNDKPHLHKNNRKIN